jgi:hypothetical protein
MRQLAFAGVIPMSMGERRRVGQVLPKNSHWFRRFLWFVVILLAIIAATVMRRLGILP